MSGGCVVKDSAEGGVSPGLHERERSESEEDWGDPRRCRQGILDDAGAASPHSLEKPGSEATSALFALGMWRVRSSPAGTGAKRSPEEPGPKGNAQISIQIDFPGADHPLDDFVDGPDPASNS